MQVSRSKISRNVSVDIVRLVASIMVVFIHIRFPTGFGSLVRWFFAVSGFFSYGVSCDCLIGRMKHMIRLIGWGYVLSLGIRCIAVECGAPFMAQYQNNAMLFLKESFSGWNNLPAFVFLDRTPVNEGLWYLIAALKCYGVLWCYVRFFGEKKPDYRMLYLTGFLLFVINILLGVMNQTAGTRISPELLRNAVTLGIPMFAMGIFMRQYWEQIWDNFQLTPEKLALLFLLGCAMSVMEQWTVGISDAHVGSILIVLSLLMYAARYPTPVKNPALIAAAERSASWSVGIYLVHPPVIKILTGVLSQTPYASSSAVLWLQPVCVALISLLLAMANTEIYHLIRRKRNR